MTSESLKEWEIEEIVATAKFWIVSVYIFWVTSLCFSGSDQLL